MEEQYIIPGHLRKEFDLPLLMKNMKKADWYYEYSEDSSVWRAGLKEIAAIKHQLLEIALKDEGMKLANWLWDKFVPEHSVVKPEFLIEKNKTGQTNAMPASSEVQPGSSQQRRDHAQPAEPHNDLSENKNMSKAARHIKEESLLPKKRTGNKKGLSM